MINVIKFDSISSALNEKMNKFEESFRYPLGNSGTFSISHGDDYGRFFRAMGKSKIYLACYEGEIVGSLAMVQRPLSLNGQNVSSLYIGDLKIKRKSGRVLYCLIKEAHDDNIELRDIPQFGVMMKGTERRPSDYTGRMGLPKFKNMGEVAIIRVPVQRTDSKIKYDQIGISGALSLSEELRDTHYSFPIGRPNIRSLKTPKGFCLQDKSSVCILEDTLTAKRLYDDKGEEIVSGHLSSFQYGTVQEGVKLVKALMPEAEASSYPALFFSVPFEDKNEFLNLLEGATCAPAFVYGRNMERAERWQLNTSEI